MVNYFSYTKEDKENLKKCDPILSQYIDRIGDIQIVVEPDLFIALVHSIVGQQISIKAQATIWKRFVMKVNTLQEQEKRVFQEQTISLGKSCEELETEQFRAKKNEFRNKKNEFRNKKNEFMKEEMTFAPHRDDELEDGLDTSSITPSIIAFMKEEDIQSCGMSFKKAQNILDLAHKIHTKAFDLEGLKTQSNEECIKQLSTLKGVGKWTAQMMLLFSLQRQDIFSLGDLGIQKGLCLIYDLEEFSKKDHKVYQEKFSPYGSLASLYLWQIVGLGIKPRHSNLRGSASQTLRKRE